MNKNEKRTLVLSTVICLLPIVLTLVLYNKLPDKIPVHFDISWKPDGYSSKWMAGIGLPVIMAVVSGIVQASMIRDKRKGVNGRIVRVLGVWLIPVLSVLITPMCLFVAMGYQVMIDRVIPSVLAVIFIVIGNYLPKCRRNFMIGIRIPWTLMNEENWRRTHHLSGYLWILGGLAMLIYCWSGCESTMIMGSILGAMVVIPCIYSFLLSRKLK
ncbi:hypothetical protein lbkm_1442 [Lachnospiraceae bacterium KM106-2]|nr:hypothetical protein lbkm_1442 [Lachnospiraceae bacterium KM106-2]